VSVVCQDDQDVYILSKVSDIMHSLLGTYKEAMLPVFEQLLPHFVKLLVSITITLLIYVCNSVSLFLGRDCCYCCLRCCRACHLENIAVQLAIVNTGVNEQVIIRGTSAQKLFKCC